MSYTSMDREMGAYMQRHWRDVRVGDFVELECDEVIPADILLLATSDPHYICYIETANIDGETNLKQRTVMPGIVENLLPLVSDGLCVFVYIYRNNVSCPRTCTICTAKMVTLHS